MYECRIIPCFTIITCYILCFTISISPACGRRGSGPILPDWRFGSWPSCDTVVCKMKTRAETNNRSRVRIPTRGEFLPGNGESVFKTPPTIRTSKGLSTISKGLSNKPTSKGNGESVFKTPPTIRTSKGLYSEGWNSHAHRESPGIVESANLSREIEHIYIYIYIRMYVCMYVGR